MSAASSWKVASRVTHFRLPLAVLFLVFASLLVPPGARGQDKPQEEGGLQSVDDEMEALRAKLVDLNTDLDALEQDLLAPHGSSVKIFLTSNAGKKFALQSVKVLLDDRMVGTHVYRDEENLALQNGGAQELYEGAVPVGDHAIIAQFSGEDLVQSRVNQAIKIKFKGKEKTLTFVELRVGFSADKKKPSFTYEIYE